MRPREIFHFSLRAQRKAAWKQQQQQHTPVWKNSRRVRRRGEGGARRGRRGKKEENSSRPRERGFFVSDDKYISKHTRNGLERRRVAATTTGDWPICETRATRVATHLFAVPELDYYNTFTNYALPCRGRTGPSYVFSFAARTTKMSPRKRSNGRCAVAENGQLCPFVFDERNSKNSKNGNVIRVQVLAIISDENLFSRRPRNEQIRNELICRPRWKSFLSSSSSSSFQERSNLSVAVEWNILFSFWKSFFLATREESRLNLRRKYRIERWFDV